MSDELLAGQAKELFRLMTIEQAAKKLCKCKGRYHTEIAMRELMKLFESEKNESMLNDLRFHGVENPERLIK